MDYIYLYIYLLNIILLEFMFFLLKVWSEKFPKQLVIQKMDTKPELKNNKNKSASITLQAIIV